jgi:hypothetical protein
VMAATVAWRSRDATSSCPGTSCHHWRQRRERRDHPSDLSNSFLNKRSLSDSPSSVSTTDFALPTGLSIILLRYRRSSA